MARAHLLAGNPEKAKALAEKVPLSFAEEARPGKARIIEAAALVMMASNLAGGERDALILAAKTSFLEGVRQDAPYWSGIIAGGARNLQEPFDKVVALLGPWAAQWLDEMRPKAG